MWELRGGEMAWMGQMGLSSLHYAVSPTLRSN
jgi:hypothetical protein